MCSHKVRVILFVEVKKFIIFADAVAKSMNIISLDVNYFMVQTLFRLLGNQRPVALDFDPIEERVYWSDVAQGLIISAFLMQLPRKFCFAVTCRIPTA